MKKTIVILLVAGLFFALNRPVYATEMEKSRDLLDVLYDQTSDELRELLSDKSLYRPDEEGKLPEIENCDVPIFTVYSAGVEYSGLSLEEQLLRASQRKNTYTYFFILADEIICIGYGNWEKDTFLELRGQYSPNYLPNYLEDIIGNDGTKRLLSGEMREVKRIHCFREGGVLTTYIVIFETDSGVFVQLYGCDDNFKALEPVDFTWEDYDAWATAYNAYKTERSDRFYEDHPELLYGGGSDSLTDFISKYETPQSYYDEVVLRERTDKMREFFVSYGIYMVLGVVFVIGSITAAVVLKKRKSA